ncbi:MAG TPA: dTDP-4-dehydrorhamnose 3,5-epimerase [Mycobacteriales bacterium]|nr:dTDP-4-dehydrorhamnose 3,5-epimerase [Mycobacteriales bacterium]
MQVTPLRVEGAWSFTPRQFPDPRGLFLEWFRGDVLAETVGHPLEVRQANHSVSSRGTLRGVHFADVPPGQAKYVYCTRGAVLDVVIDLRVGSPTFGASDAVRLDDVDRKGVYLSEGLGHAFLALTDDVNVTYLCSTTYTPAREHAVHPLDRALALPWPSEAEPLLSDKDAAAPTLAEARAAGLLPSYDACQAYYAELRTKPMDLSGQ